MRTGQRVDLKHIVFGCGDEFTWLFSYDGLKYRAIHLSL